MLSWVPDAPMLKLQYRLHTGRKLNLKNPQRFTEKLQLYKLKYRNPEMLRCTDKFEVRGFVEDHGLGEILIPLIGIYNSVSEINFAELPDKFVAKTTDGGGGNQIFICRNKAELSEAEFFTKLNGWMAQPKVKKSAGREWAYENNYPRRILIEELIEDGVHKDIPDYKFFCFNGEPRYCQVIGDRSTCETIDFFDMGWNHMPFCGLNPKCGPAAQPAAKPAAFEVMKQIARDLSKDLPFARIDLYAVDHKTYFGEVTFYPASGYGVFTPDEWDNKLGDLLTLPEGVKMGGGKRLIISDKGYEMQEDSLNDYKFFCFNGKVECIYGISDRQVGVGAQLGIYDRNFRKLDVDRLDERHQAVALPKPENFDRMVAVAEQLSADFPEVRVDLYNVAGKIYFGELTFYDGSGYMKFSPDSFDFELGKKFSL
jgi:hypothetical protein